MRNGRVLLRAALALLAVIIIAGSSSAPETSVFGRDFRLCVQFCEGVHEACLVTATEDCAAIFEGDPDLIWTCFAMMNLRCVDDYKECRGICKADPEFLSPRSPLRRSPR